MILTKYLLPLFTAMLIIACTENNTKQVGSKNNVGNISNLATPLFNADSAFYFIEKQLNFGPRVPNSQAHEKCGDYLISEIEKYSDEVYIQKFKAKAYNNNILRGRNIIGSFNPNNEKRILLIAHWDSRHVADYDSLIAKKSDPVLGANDGASGVGILLELARLMNQEKPTIGVDILFTDLEDYGPTSDYISDDRDEYWCLGAQYWSKTPHIPGYKANYGILLDMVGAKDATFYYESFSMQYAPDIMKRIWEIAAKKGHQKYFIKENGGYITDDHYFINKMTSIPTIDIIDTKKNSGHSFFDAWHTTHDNISNIDKHTLNAVGETLIELIYNGK